MSNPIMKLGTNMGWAVRLLLPCLQDTAVAPWVAMVFGAWKLAPEEVIPALAACLRSTDPSLRAVAADALSEFGTRASSVMPDLLVVLSDTEPDVRVMATNAVHKIAPDVLKKGEH
jgi:hypothetical protein